MADQKEPTDAEVIARGLEAMAEWQAENGEFTEEELRQAEEELRRAEEQAAGG